MPRRGPPSFPRIIMRVVLNRQPTLGARTGIGHYTAELLSAMAAEAGEDEIHVYPTGWVWRLHGLLAGHGTTPSTRTAGGWWQRCVGRSLGCLRRVVSAPAVRSSLRTLQPIKFRHFQAICRREQYDLYHEPNILAMPCDLPTVAT